jgi:hypothetical protein
MDRMLYVCTRSLLSHKRQIFLFEITRIGKGWLTDTMLQLNRNKKFQCVNSKVLCILKFYRKDFESFYHKEILNVLEDGCI